MRYEVNENGLIEIYNDKNEFVICHDVNFFHCAVDFAGDKGVLDAVLTDIFNGLSEGKISEISEENLVISEVIAKHELFD